jgi:hypothetical protein
MTVSGARSSKTLRRSLSKRSFSGVACAAGDLRAKGILKMENPFDQFGQLRRDVSELEIASMSNELRPKYLALVSAALDSEDCERAMRADEAALFAAVDVARVARETLESVVPKISFHDCWKAVMERPREQF